MSNVPATEVISNPKPVLESKQPAMLNKDMLYTAPVEAIKSDLTDEEIVVEPVLEQKEEIQIDKKQEDELTDLFTALLG